MVQSQTPIIKWSGYEWMLQERWGQVHPSKSHWWYDPNQVFIDEKELLHLRTGPSEKYFEHLKLSSKVGAGLISCLEQFTFGTFVLKAKLPYGKNLWPSFWMWSWTDWPPEIDVFEGFSDFTPTFESLSATGRSRISFLDKLLGRKTVKDLIVKPNLHIRSSNGDHTALTTLYPEKDKNFRTKRNLTESFFSYKLTWTPSYLEVYYEDTLVLFLHKNMGGDVANILDQLAAHKMNVVINNGVTSFVDVNSPPVSDFVLESFNYYPYITI